MTYADLRAAVEQAIGAVPFEPPLTPAYSAKVRDALRQCAPSATSTEAYYRVATKRSAAEFVVQARYGDIIYTLTVPIP